MKKSFFLRNATAQMAFGILLVVVLAAILAPWLVAHSIESQHLDHLLQGPSQKFPFGTDRLGRDLFARVLYGARVSLLVALLSAVVALLIGGVYGAIAGWLGGWTETILMRFVDVVYSVPSLVLMILIKMSFDSWQLVSDPQWRAGVATLLALSLVGWVGFARVVRAQVLQIKQESFIKAGQALGLNQMQIIRAHILPNALGPLLVLLSYKIPGNILYESFLSFIGLGLQPPLSSWGLLIADGAQALESHPHLIFFPGLALVLTLMALQIFGDHLRGTLEPLRKNHESEVT